MVKKTDSAKTAKTVTAKNRSVRSDSVEGMLAAIQSAQLPDIEPPKHIKLRPQDMPFWSTVTASRAKAEWSHNDLVLAAQLARCQADIEEQTALIYKTDPLRKTKNGNLVITTRVDYLELLMKRQMYLIRTLRLGSASIASAREMQRFRQQEREAGKVFDELKNEDPHGLLA